MAITVNFWTMSKSVNSTKDPGISTPTAFSCVLKDNCSVLDPEIEIQTNTSPQTLNYAQIPSFGNRYYFVNDWTYYRGVWSAHLVEDVLATYKSDIGSSYQMITRSANTNLWNQYLLDTEYLASGSNGIIAVTNAQYPDTNPYVTEIQNGSYVIGIANNDSVKTYGGSVSYYVLTPASLNLLKAYLMEFNNWTNIDSTMQAVYKFEFNPLQYIVSCNYFPFDYTDMPRTHTTGGSLTVQELSFVPMGWWNTPSIPNFKMWTVSNVGYGTLTGYINVPKHPSASTRGKYLNLDPYMRYILTFRPFGEIVLDSTYLIDTNFVYYTIKFDAITGEAVLELFNSSTAQANDLPFATYRSVICTPVQLSQITQDLIGTAQGVVNMVESAFNPLAAIMGGTGQQLTKGQSAGKLMGAVGPVGAIIDATVSAVRSTIPQMQTIGSAGAYVEYSYTPRIYAQYFAVTDDYTPRVGHPCYQYIQVNQSSGFTLCKDVKLDLAATNDEINLVKQYMEAGFYYE